MTDIKSVMKKPFEAICGLLILLAPLLITKLGCWFLYGEPECPDLLKDSISNE